MKCIEHFRCPATPGKGRRAGHSTLTTCLLLFGLLLVVASLWAVVSEVIAFRATGQPLWEWNPVLKVNLFARASYLVILLPYYGLLAGMAWRYRVIFDFANWWFFARASFLVMLVMGLALEWFADILYVWSFPPGRDFFLMTIPIFGNITHHKVPVCELLWIVGVVPLFYFLWFWATLVFHDVIYVVELVDGKEKFYKKEERWAGFHSTTRILKRRKGERGREKETPLLERPPGFVSRGIRRFRHVEKS